MNVEILAQSQRDDLESTAQSDVNAPAMIAQQRAIGVG
jgi:hypothetical protein